MPTSSRPDEWWMYVVRTAVGTFYCGMSVSVYWRVGTHNRGKGAKYLRGSRLPVNLLKSWCFTGPDARSNALKAEAWFKRQPRWKKVEIILGEQDVPARFGYDFAAEESYVSRNSNLLRGSP